MEPALQPQQTDSQPHADELVPVAHVTSRRKKRENINDIHEERLSKLQRLALWITDNIGTMGFFLIIFCWTVCWLSWIYLAHRFGWPGVVDKPFEFGVWLFMSNLIQLMIMPLIMVGQNLQSRHAEIRAEQEFHITQQTEHEMEVALRYLERIHHDLKKVNARLDALEKK
jgi:uncharacterized membrane protein